MPVQEALTQMVLDKPGHTITLYRNCSCVTDYGGAHDNDVNNI